MHAIYLVQFTRILASAVLSIHSNVVSFRITVDWRTFIDNIMPTYKLVFGERLGFLKIFCGCLSKSCVRKSGNVTK